VQVLGGDGGPTALHPSAPEVVLSQYQGTGNLFRSVTGGPGVVPTATGIALGDRNAFFCPIAFARGDANVAWYATHRVYRSEDAGVSWTAVSADITGGPPAAIRTLEPGPAGSDALWAVTNEGVVLRSEDAGATFEATFGDAVAWSRTTRELAADPIDAATAVLAIAQFGADRVLLTEDGGASWMSVTGDLPDVPALSAAIGHIGDTRWIFVGTDAGVFLTCNDGDAWELLGEALPNAPVVDVLLEADGSSLFAATMGRGAWRVALADLPAECPLVGDTDSETGTPGDTMPLLDLPPPSTTMPMTTSEPPMDESTTSTTDAKSTGSAAGSEGCGCRTSRHDGTLAWLLLLALAAVTPRKTSDFAKCRRTSRNRKFICDPAPSFS
jgi:MYXO-CTERM domain-containing protein